VKLRKKTIVVCNSSRNILEMFLDSESFSLEATVFRRRISSLSLSLSLLRERIQAKSIISSFRNRSFGCAIRRNIRTRFTNRSQSSRLVREFDLSRRSRGQEVAAARINMAFPSCNIVHRSTDRANELRQMLQQVREADVTRSNPDEVACSACAPSQNSSPTPRRYYGADRGSYLTY